MKKTTKIFLIFIGSIALLLFLLNIAAPDQVSPFYVLLIFGLFFVVIDSFLVLLMILLNSIRNQVLGQNNLLSKKLYIYSSLISIGVVVILAIQSLKPISVYELALVAIAVSIASFYVYKS